MTRNTRIKPFVFCDTYDPFTESLANPDENVRTIAPVTTSNGLTRTDARTLADVIPSQCSKLDKAALAQRYIVNPQRLQDADLASQAFEEHAKRNTVRAVNDFRR